MNAGSWCHARDVLRECLSWQIDQFRALTKADGPPRAPMHRDRTIWTNSADGLCRLRGVEMALTQGGSPTPDWHQGEVDVRHLIKGKVRTRVPGIPASARAPEEIAERGPAVSTPGVSPTVVIGGQNAYLQAGSIYEVTRLDLPKLHAAGDHRPEQAARTRWRDENRGGPNESKRR